MVRASCSIVLIVSHEPGWIWGFIRRAVWQNRSIGYMMRRLACKNRKPEPLPNTRERMRFVLLQMQTHQ